ncbi:MAG: hypothetical protein BWY54_00090 [Candidatus Dependentiae bacterium ADurb.Bin331]|nr:MAG: hypothetical protein BWY54_00090 [Candidatus Dependentiae bacterium ADurb.Bin331]
MKKKLLLLTIIASLAQYKNVNAMENRSLYCDETLEPEKKMSLYCDEIIDDVNGNTFSPGKKKIPNPTLYNQSRVGKRKFAEFNIQNSDITNDQAPFNFVQSEETDEIDAATLLLGLNPSSKKDEAREFFEKIKNYSRPSDSTNGTLAREMLNILKKHPSLDVNNFKLEIVINTNKKTKQFKLIDLAVKMKAETLYSHLIANHNAQLTDQTEQLIKQCPRSRIANITGHRKKSKRKSKPLSFTLNKIILD